MQNITFQAYDPNQPSGSSSSRRGRGIGWTHLEEEVLIETYAKFNNALENSSNPQAKERTQAELENDYSNQVRTRNLRPRTSDQIQGKWNSLVAAYKAENTRIHATGNSGEASTMRHFQKLDSIMGEHATINPPNTYSSHTGVFTDLSFDNESTVENTNENHDARPATPITFNTSAPSTSAPFIFTPTTAPSTSAPFIFTPTTAPTITPTITPITEPTTTPITAPISETTPPTTNSRPEIPIGQEPATSRRRTETSAPSQQIPPTFPSTPLPTDLPGIESLFNRLQDRAEVRNQRRFEDYIRFHTTNMNNNNVSSQNIIASINQGNTFLQRSANQIDNLVAFLYRQHNNPNQ